MLAHPIIAIGSEKVSVPSFNLLADHNRFRRRDAEVEMRIKSRVMMPSRVIPLKKRCARPCELATVEVETAAAEQKHGRARPQNGSVEIGHAVPGKRCHFDDHDVHQLGKARNMSQLLRTGRGRLGLVRNEPPLPCVLYGESPIDVAVTSQLGVATCGCISQEGTCFRVPCGPAQQERVNQPMTFIGIGRTMRRFARPV